MAAPGLNEIITTTARNRKMGKGAPVKKAGNQALEKRAIDDVHRTGTHVPEKDFSTKKKIDAAAAGGKAGSYDTGKGQARANSTTISSVKAHEIPSIAHDKPPAGYDGGMKDWSDDHRQARHKGLTPDQWENSAADRLADKRGEKTLRDDENDKVHHAPKYKAGVAAFTNGPKISHGWGHTDPQKHGHLRMSGNPHAHQIGRKKR